MDKLRAARSTNELRAVWTENHEAIMALEQPLKAHAVNLKDVRKRELDRDT